MKEDIIQFVQSCPKCQKNRAAKHKLHGLLQALEPAYLPWKSRAMDFITDLILNEDFDQLWVIMDRFTKRANSIPLKKMNKKAEDLGEVCTPGLWKLDSIPANINSDSKF
jgi:hypothetical protein